MNRLTFDGNFCDISKCAEVGFWPECKTDGCSQKQVWERLKHYEDLEEQGRLVELPCSVGGKIFDISEGEIYEYSADYIGIELDHGELFFVIEGDYFAAKELGETFFSKRTEAEAALAASGKEGEQVTDKEYNEAGRKGKRVMRNFILFLTVLPGSLYRTLKYASTIPFWEWF